MSHIRKAVHLPLCRSDGQVHLIRALSSFGEGFDGLFVGVLTSISIFKSVRWFRMIRLPQIASIQRERHIFLIPIWRSRDFHLARMGSDTEVRACPSCHIFFKVRPSIEPPGFAISTFGLEAWQRLEQAFALERILLRTELMQALR